MDAEKFMVLSFFEVSAELEWLIKKLQIQIYNKFLGLFLPQELCGNKFYLKKLVLGCLA